MDNSHAACIYLMACTDPEEIIGNVYDEKDIATALNDALPGFEYPDWAHRTIKQLVQHVQHKNGWRL